MRYESTFFVPTSYYLDMKKLGFTPISNLQCLVNKDGTKVDGYFILVTDAAIIQELGIPIERG